MRNPRTNMNTSSTPYLRERAGRRTEEAELVSILPLRFWNQNSRETAPKRLAEKGKSGGDGEEQKNNQSKFHRERAGDK